MKDGLQDELLYRLALTFVPGVGVRIGKELLQRYGSATEIFKTSLKELRHFEGIGEVKAKGFKDPEIIKLAEAELEYVIKHNISTILYGAEGYPTRLSNCSDAPLILFCKGDISFEYKRVVAIVGTRKNTEYGVKLTEDLVEGLQGPDVLVVSGLAAGIDTIAHRKAVKLAIPTIGVLGHGHDRMYPASNKELSKEMMKNGGVITEFPSGTIPEKGNFPLRNRIVAGMTDVTVVVESDISGGALITAMMASGYNREVAAFPGRVTDSRSSGCHELIRTQVAHIITCAGDLMELMNWKDAERKKPVQRQLFLDLPPQQKKIVDLLHTGEPVHADEIYYKTGLANSELAVTLLDLEMQGMIKTLPGKFYRLT